MKFNFYKSCELEFFFIFVIVFISKQITLEDFFGKKCAKCFSLYSTIFLPIVTQFEVQKKD